MFDATEHPRVFGVPAGVDFSAELINGLRQHLSGTSPEAMGAVQLIVNTQRMKRRLRTLFDAGPVGFVPKIALVTQMQSLAPTLDIPPAMSPLRRRFEVISLVSQLLRQQPDLASRASLYDLADSLAGLIDEMNGEGVSPEVIANLDVTDQSGHWERAQKFFGIVNHFLDGITTSPDAESRQRMVVEKLITHWKVAPPAHPVILAGSTGSRGTTMLLMQAVAKLPQGAVILPGFDFDMPASIWGRLNDALQSEDHPQFRFAKLMQVMGVSREQIVPWSDAVPANPARNRLVSLALRPAPVTDQWLSEGKTLTDIGEACKDITLLEAPSVREEALAIAMRLREAAETGQTVALITPDRMLTRQVSAALDRWDIMADDSAGTPMQLTPPGRFLRHVAGLRLRPLTSEALLTLLKHPLTHSAQDRNEHLRRTRDLELYLRKKGVTFPDAEQLAAWASAQKEDLSEWIAWLIACFCDQVLMGEHTFIDLLESHVALAERISAGDADTAGELWQEAAGRKAEAVVEKLRVNAEYAGALSAGDYADVFGSVLSQEELRDRDAPHANILIWGTLEARVQGVDMIILGGLNEGSWPEAPSPDPWLNRQMRDKAGLLLPERRIGLSAHDFQQAVAGKEVWLTRSIRTDEAETVASRWVNRLTNLLSGLPEQGGRDALEEMRRRGRDWLAKTAALETVFPVEPAKRPSPRPPEHARPRQLSVTEIKRLIRDPYAIYARHVLRLRRMDPLMKTPDALLRGIVVHEVLEKFVKDAAGDRAHLTADHLLTIARDVLVRDVPWASARALWNARLNRVSDHFVTAEAHRQTQASPLAYEARAEATIDDLAFKLTGTADRIDRAQDGRLILYDYKTGSPPSKAEQEFFDKQLLLEAAMAEQGGFKGIAPEDVVSAIYLGLGNPPKEVAAPLDDMPTEKVWDEFKELISRYLDAEQGFSSRRAMQKDGNAGDYDQLARFGEWDATDLPNAEDVS